MMDTSQYQRPLSFVTWHNKKGRELFLEVCNFMEPIKILGEARLNEK